VFLFLSHVFSAPSEIEDHLLWELFWGCTHSWVVAAECKNEIS
jgi:hypothetical protein